MKRIKLCDGYNFIQQEKKRLQEKLHIYEKIKYAQLIFMRNEIFLQVKRVIPELVHVTLDSTIVLKFLLRSGVLLLLQDHSIYASDKNGYSALFFTDSKYNTHSSHKLHEETSKVVSRIIHIDWLATLQRWSNTSLSYWEDRYNYMIFVWHFKRVFDRCIRKHLWKYFI
jgi:hypothetical protein